MTTDNLLATLIDIANTAPFKVEVLTPIRYHIVFYPEGGGKPEQHYVKTYTLQEARQAMDESVEVLTRAFPVFRAARIDPDTYTIDHESIPEGRGTYRIVEV